MSSSSWRWLLLCLLAACSGLADVRGMIAGLQEAQLGLQRDLGLANVTVSHGTGGLLTVTLVNSPLAALPDDQRRAKARQIAEYLRDHYAGYGRVQRVAVGFQSMAGVGGFSVAKTVTPYAFSVQQLGPAPAADAPTAPGGSPVGADTARSAS